MVVLGFESVVRVVGLGCWVIVSGVDGMVTVCGGSVVVVGWTGVAGSDAGSSSVELDVRVGCSTTGGAVGV